MMPPYGSAPSPFTLTPVPTRSTGTVRVRAEGYLDYDTCDDFLVLATRCLDQIPAPDSLHLDCSGVDGLDSMGLAALLMLHRRCTAARVTLRLGPLHPTVDRILRLTGTLAHLAPGTAAGGTTIEPGGHGRPSPQLDGDA
ncbi:STAS domain-containing protein [Streptomyces sp. NPDC059164]|uniref:STAS domain-containing protein n=1 Tax=unclassified Streptomyces TaxID=2593676 RepID=UPI000934B94F|nr:MULTISPECIES: STAS domain-containing protein [unclassified Streptomyces]QWQ42764.1 STAS domain-containing protein [Streptomyces sp. YPW6]